MRFLKLLEKLLPHFLIVLAGMFLTFFIIDKYNNAMEFINNDISKALILVWCVISFICAAAMIVYQRKNHDK